MVARFVSRWDPDKLNYCVRAKGRSNNRTVGDLNGHPRKIINTKITVRMDTTRRQTETRDAVAKIDSARFRYGGEDVRNRSLFRVLGRRGLRWLRVDSAFVPIGVLNIDNCFKIDCQVDRSCKNRCTHQISYHLILEAN